jgi:hypothetical protein
LTKKGKIQSWHFCLVIRRQETTARLEFLVTDFQPHTTSLHNEESIHGLATMLERKTHAFAPFPFVEFQDVLWDSNCWTLRFIAVEKI